MSSKAKKPGKGDQIPKPISIKKEKSEEDRTLHPLSHYIDDRLELVKQIFGTLKPKTIVNLAPEFLKKTPLDEIEALCLDELLCLSTKRLKSIIEATRCPTDTESSEDSDVEHKEEHISLEEISSDSDIGGQESRKTKKKLKAKNTKASNGNEDKESGQMSVLELLELQARARAIRSQLAMEPITKIEVKSDEDDDANDDRPAKPVQRKTKEKRTAKSTDTGKRSSQAGKANKKDQSQDADSSSKEQPTPRKKIKLKRNYRQTSKSPEKENIEKVSAPAPAPSAAPIANRPRSKSRSASPDVITIQTEPETLLISDSTDDESTNHTTKAAPEPEPKPALEPTAPLVESEPEEGEVRDEPEEPAKTVEPAKIEEAAKTEDPAKAEETAMAEDQPKTENPRKNGELEEPEESSKKTEDQSKPAEEEPAEKRACSKERSPPPEAKETAAVPETANIDDEDQNDDVISIGGDLDMIEEMTKEDEPKVTVKSEKKSKGPEEHDELDNDVISLDTSEDERDKLQQPDSESWRTRYLKSSKVSQVLAASRLGKRVRDKIKTSKRSKAAAGDEQAQTEKQPAPFTSKHEDGSMEQYQELLQHRQRKTSNSSKGGDK